MPKNNFQEILEKLNDNQREAVETIYGPVMVIAGPGSGKTQLLSARIAYILENTDYLPNNILCLTFTENAAKNMRERLASMIGHDAYKVAIHTFHSFGNEIINRFRSYAKEYSEAKVIDDITSSKILDDILEKLAWDHPYKPGFRASDIIYELKSTIGDLKKGGLTPQGYLKVIENNTKTIQEINPIIEKYFSEIDSLGRKKEDNNKKVELFLEFVSEMLAPPSGTLSPLKEKGATFGYETFMQVFIAGIKASLEDQDEKGSTKFLTAWKNSWTQKNSDGKRELKETGKLEKQLALAHVFGEYQKSLLEGGYIDFSDMILQAISLIENHDSVRMSLAENYQCIMIDEFQDTNEAQMRLIHSVISVNPEKPNIFAVGDDDQSIYKFQGANTKNLSDFKKNYEGTQLIILEKNYRSYAEVIETSRAVLNPELHDIARIFPNTQKYFESHNGTGGIVEKFVFQNEVEEYAFIAEDIFQKIESGVPAQDIAIITKKNKSLELLAKALLNKNISVNVSKEESLFEVPEVQIIIQILRLLYSLDGPERDENSEILVSVISHPCFAIDRLTLWKLSKQIYAIRKPNSKSWIEHLQTHEDPTIRDMAHFFIELAQKSRNSRLEDIIDDITGASSLSLPSEYDDEGQKQAFELTLLSGQTKEYTSPVYNYFFKSSAASFLPSGENGMRVDGDLLYAKYLANVRKFVDMIRNYKQAKPSLILSDAIDILGLIEKYKVPVSSSHVVGNSENSVNLITVHKAKGLEWMHVYAPFLTTSEYKIGKFGGSVLPKNLPLEAEKDADEDIERLVYTALTRAEKYLTLSYSRESAEEKSLELLGCFGDMTHEFQDQKPEHITEVSKVLELAGKELFELPYISQEKDFLKDQIQKSFNMNATALQGFLDITNGGPEMFVKRTLLRFPQSKNIAASYGSAMHKGLEDFFDDYTKTGTYSKNILLSGFEESLKREGFDTQLEGDFLQKGRDNLELLYPEMTGKKYSDLALEYDFKNPYGGIFLENSKGEAIRLTGKIDRIEILPDESLIITDYKTGKGFSHFDFKGQEYLKIKQWKYKLQLCFYAILFELSPRWRGYSKKSYELFFVEKDTKTNTFHTVIEYIQEGEIERTKKLICAVMNKVQNLNFPDTSEYPKTLDGIRQFEEDLIKGRI